MLAEAHYARQVGQRSHFGRRELALVVFRLDSVRVNRHGRVKILHLELPCLAFAIQGFLAARLGQGPLQVERKPLALFGGAIGHVDVVDVVLTGRQRAAVLVALRKDELHRREDTVRR